MREFLANRLDKLCAKLHWMHHIPVPHSWFDDEKYAGWRGKICHLLYGCPLASLSFRIDDPMIDVDRVIGTPWARYRPNPDDPWNDGMDHLGDPTDWEIREARNEGITR